MKQMANCSKLMVHGHEIQNFAAPLTSLPSVTEYIEYMQTVGLAVVSFGRLRPGHRVPADLQEQHHRRTSTRAE